jgi:hypothetical protein
VRIVTLTAAELRSLLREIVRDELAQLVEDLGTEATGPRLLTRQLMARQLGCSLASLHKLVAEGCPFVRIGNAPRFDPRAVQAWLGAVTRRRQRNDVSLGASSGEWSSSDGSRAVMTQQPNSATAAAGAGRSVKDVFRAEKFVG